MDRVLRKNRKRDEYEIEDDWGSDFSVSDSEDEDPNFVASDEENYENDSSEEEAMEPLEQSMAEDIAANPQNKYLSKDKKIEYSTEPFEISRRNSFRRADNIVSGPKVIATTNVVDPLTAFQMFIRPIELIVLNMTNLFGTRKYKDQWENIYLVAINAYYGLLLLGGVYRSYGECVTQLWDEKTGRPIFRATMPLKNFKRIHGCNRFDDRQERLSSAVRDKLAPIRNVYDRWNSNLKCMYTRLVVIFFFFDFQYLRFSKYEV